VAAAETRIETMTHEEMAQRIGASRETVTRLWGAAEEALDPSGRTHAYHSRPHRLRGSGSFVLPPRAPEDGVLGCRSPGCF
jgi:hypothetical protein